MELEFRIPFPCRRVSFPFLFASSLKTGHLHTLHGYSRVGLAGGGVEGVVHVPGVKSSDATGVVIRPSDQSVIVEAKTVVTTTWGLQVVFSTRCRQQRLSQWT